MENGHESRTLVVLETETAQVLPAPLDRRLVWMMAVACAFSIANLYYVQPLLALMGQSFRLSVNQIGGVATLMQLGFASGLLLVVPLGDRYPRRTLIVSLLVVVTLALLLVATSPTISVLSTAGFILGFATVVPQLLVPLAASQAAPFERGRVVGTVMSGLLIGILLARVVSGMIGALFGWRAVYWSAAVLMIVLALVLRFFLPADRQRSTMSYGQLLRSLGSLLRTELVLREAGIFYALSFGAFSAFWVTLTFFLQTPPYHYGSAVAGLFGLVGVVGALSASIVGRLADRFPVRSATGIALLIVLLSFFCMWLIGYWLWGLILGVILLDLGTQAVHVSNQTRIYSLNPDARNRLNTVYMVTGFIGGALGSFLGTWGWSLAGWNGVCSVGSLMLAAALAVYIINSKCMARKEAERAL
ncbi:permease [Reticulibacter mediterranei]|uniref:Permease n=1 Tax=Reticulibacter mediterranei TaxID=2778369 RepID=A0A8J3ICQ0_9CHLR|nr:MFS transporter [Reticulibacter mediterranei]GHO89990.1 permease [Reticulibacter mediterranei]